MLPRSTTASEKAKTLPCSLELYFFVSPGTAKNEEFIGLRLSDRFWVYNLDSFFGILVPLSVFSASVCTVLCCFLDASHFVEYKMLSMYMFLHVPVLICRTQPLLHGRRVAILFFQKLQPWYLLLMVKDLWINEERIGRKQLVSRVASFGTLGLFIGTIFFFLCLPLTWLSIAAVAG